MRKYASFDSYLEGQTRGNRAIISALRRFVGYVQFGFFHGSALKDPKGLLEGEGKYVRHAKVRDPSAIDERAFAALLRQAAGT